MVERDSEDGAYLSLKGTWREGSHTADPEG